MIVRIQVARILKGGNVAPELGQRLPRTTGTERCRVDIPAVQLVDKVIAHIAGVQQYLSRKPPLDEEVPRLHLTPLEFARCGGADLDVWWRRHFAAGYVRGFGLRDALGESGVGE